jgi:hypothetical protein
MKSTSCSTRTYGEPTSHVAGGDPCAPTDGTFGGPAPRRVRHLRQFACERQEKGQFPFQPPSRSSVRQPAYIARSNQPQVALDSKNRRLAMGGCRSSGAERTRLCESGSGPPGPRLLGRPDGSGGPGLVWRAWDGLPRSQSVRELRPHFPDLPGDPEGSGSPGSLASDPPLSRSGPSGVSARASGALSN